MQERGTITIHSENIFPIIKQSLYSEREIFLRELVSNAADAISKLRMAKLAGEIESVLDPEITIKLDKENRLLQITDTGIGMTVDEVKKYINQVAFSSAEDYLNKYKGTEESIIGHFGLGFYSSFMVSTQVEIDTLSYAADSIPVHWSCSGNTEFEISDSDRTTVGTTITLHLAEGEEEYLEPGRIQELIRKYCDFIPVPIKLDDEVINRQHPLWRRSPSELTDEDYLEFYRYLYPFQEDPHFWVHINTDYPFIVQGILYFPKLRPDLDPTKGQVKLFCNQVFVQDNCEEVIPRFLLPLRGAIDSPDIPLNVSRSYLQGDRTVRRIGDHVAKKVADRLNNLYKENLEEYEKTWPDISLFMKFGSMNSDKFWPQVKDIFIFKQMGGDPTYTTLASYLEHTQEAQNKTVYYATDEAAQSSYIDLHVNQGLKVLMLDSWIDTHFSSFLEQSYSEEGVKFKRVDSELDESLINADEKTEIVDPTTNKTRTEMLADLFKGSLGKEKIQIKAQPLKSESVPAMILIPEALRRFEEMNALLQQKAADFLEEHTLLVNTAHPLVQNLQALANSGRDPELVKLLCQHIYDLALVTQKSFDADSARAFVERSNAVLTRLTTHQN